MSDAPDNERDPRPVSAGERGLGGRGAGAGARAAEAGPRPGPGNPAGPRRAPSPPGAGSRHRIGIRELRQHASVYVDLAEKGYTVDITNRGRLVAQLVPVTEPGARWNA